MRLPVLLLGASLFAGPVSAQAPANSTTPLVADAIDAIVQRHHETRGFEGAVLVVDAGEVVYEGAAGLADRSWDIAHTVETRFRVASITKLFTAVLTLQLADEGLLSLEDPVSAHLPDFPKPAGDQIQLRHLLMHTSALPAYTQQSENGWAPYRTPRTAEQIVSAYATGDLGLRPGTRFNYNNLDFVVLGLVIEAAGGDQWEEALRTRILEPAGLTDTGVLRSTTIVDRLAQGYTILGDKAYQEPLYFAEAFGAAGALYSTVRDLYRFDRALHQGQLLSESAKTQLYTSDPNLGYVALGNWTYPHRYTDAAGASRTVTASERRGSIGGFNATFLRHLETEDTVIILSNTNAYDPDSWGDPTALKAELAAVVQ